MSNSFYYNFGIKSFFMLIKKTPFHTFFQVDLSKKTRWGGGWCYCWKVKRWAWKGYLDTKSFANIAISRTFSSVLTWLNYQMLSPGIDIIFWILLHNVFCHFVRCTEFLKCELHESNAIGNVIEIILIFPSLNSFIIYVDKAEFKYSFTNLNPSLKAELNKSIHNTNQRFNFSL